MKKSPVSTAQHLFTTFQTNESSKQLFLPTNMLSTAPILALLTASASAAAVPTYSAPWVWHVSGATSACTGASSCQYSFSVSASAGPFGQPSFDASGCFGTSVQGGFKSCSVVGVDVPGDVLAQEINHGVDKDAEIDVRFTFEQ